MNDGLEREYRRVLRWYPTRWRSANEDAVLGTLLERADDERRTSPARGELADLRKSAMVARFGFLARVYPRAVRDRAAAVVLGVATSIAMAAFVHTLTAQFAYVTYGSREDSWAGHAPAISGIAICAVWIAALVATLVGAARIARWLELVTLPLLLAERVFENHVYQVTWLPTSTMLVLMLFALLAAAGTPSRVLHGRAAAAIALGVSTAATAFVGLRGNANPFAQSPALIANYLFGGNGYEIDSAYRFVEVDRDVLMRAFDTWAVVAIPALVLAAGILNRLAHRAWAAALLATAIPLLAGVLFTGPDAPQLSLTLAVTVLAAVVVATFYWLLRAFGFRIRITRA